MTPTVTIIMATYNRAHFIVETLNSIQQQRFKDWECLIIDDGGTDNTQEVITPILKKDLRFKFLKRPNTYKKGISGSRNYGLDIAAGDFIIFFDDDDLIHPQNLELSLYVLDTYKKDFCNYRKNPFTEEIVNYKENIVKIGQNISKKDLYEIINNDIGIASCTVLWKKECFQVHRFNEDLLYAEEIECYTRIIADGFNGIFIDNILYFNRKHSNSNTGKFFSKDNTLNSSFLLSFHLIIEYLVEKKMLSKRLIKFFILKAINHRDRILLEKTLLLSEANFFNKIKWQARYNLIPIYKLLKNFSLK